MNNKEIYPVIIKDVKFKLCFNHTPYIEIKAETLDSNKMTISSLYHFTNKSKFISFLELQTILSDFEIPINEEDIMSSLNVLKGKQAYLLKDEAFENKYCFFKDYKNASIGSEYL